MSNPFEKPVNPWPAFLLACVIDGALIIGGLMMFWRTDNVLWLAGCVLAGATVFMPALMKLTRQLRARGDFE